MKIQPVNEKKLKCEDGITIDQLLESVESLYKKANTDQKSKKILETAKEKWEKSSYYAQ